MKKYFQIPRFSVKIVYKLPQEKKPQSNPIAVKRQRMPNDSVVFYLTALIFQNAWLFQ